MPLPYQLISIDNRLVPYSESLAWQYSLQRSRQLNQTPDTLILLEHSSVITLGRSSVPERDLLVPTSELILKGIDVYEADRGGEITYHAPGQLVGYPILELSDTFGERDLHQYLRKLEQVVIESISLWGIVGTRKPGLTGVWVAEKKIAAIGIKVSRWVTMHGFALNIDIDLNPMRTDIIPCGISTLGVTSLAELGINVPRKMVEAVVIEKFEKIFSRRRLDGAGIIPT